MDNIELLWQEKAKKAKIKLESLVSSADAETLLTVMIGYICFLSPELQIGDKYGRHPAMLEALAKSLIPNFGDSFQKITTPQMIVECYDILDEYVQFNTISPSEAHVDDNQIESIEYILRMSSEVIRGNAYPEQTQRMILEIQGRFDKWFSQKSGLCPTKLVGTISSIIYDLEKHYGEWLNQFKSALNNSRPSENHDADYAYSFLKELIFSMPKILPIALEDYLLTSDEVYALKKLIGVSKSDCHGDIVIQKHPMYILTCGKVLFSHLSNLMDVAWEKFNLLAKTDKKFYARYQKHRAEWLEKEGANALKRIFPQDCIFENLTYPDPEKKTGIAELDIAVKFGPFLILLEAKSKQFRFESQRGNKKTLTADIIGNIVEAFTQNIRTIKYIASNKHVTFKETETDRTLSFASNSIQKIYPISLSLFHLAGLGSEMKRLQELGLFQDNNFPFSICLADLDLITKTNIFPEAFLHYIERRLCILSLEQDWHGDELSLFSMYLDTRLEYSNFTDNHEAVPDIIYTSSSPKFDELMLYERGLLDNPPDFRLKLPDSIKKIISEYSVYNDDSAKWIIFSLLELDNSVLYAIDQAIKNLSNYKSSGPRKIRRCVIPITPAKVVISLIASNNLSLIDLQTQNQAITLLKNTVIKPINQSD
ncbi:hypothetical protein DGG96_08955 [Legionella qingyii]|uniref:NERD domain-containing protein n=1 Tax=Legionella qingyii TaxID=2184757 RepID=A0A317U477_9GAMM|nr:hypothetical protein [Legionella qingyii]PWY56055.1 hypothetical protein DGG96_08955 [Legionella qingyii]RUR22058.1 hypothetical protein ELY20_10875 [Legionella qingyii]RUR25638.1 hypothetical protein ELY16_09685 [Legionella qingyii]